MSTTQSNKHPRKTAEHPAADVAPSAEQAAPASSAPVAAKSAAKRPRKAADSQAAESQAADSQAVETKKAAKKGSAKAPAQKAPAQKAPAQKETAAEPATESSSESAEPAKRKRKPDPQTPDVLDWSEENVEQMKAYVQWLATHFSAERMLRLVRHSFKQVYTTGYIASRPVLDINQSILKYQARLSEPQHAEALTHLHGKWLSHFRVARAFTFDEIRKNSNNPEFQKQVPATVLALCSFLAKKKIIIKGVVPHKVQRHTHTDAAGHEVTELVQKEPMAPADEALRVYIGPTLPFNKFKLVGPAYAYDNRKDDVKVRAGGDDAHPKSGLARYLDHLPKLHEVKRHREPASGAGVEPAGDEADNAEE